jgi:hypothetical protein
MCCRCNMACMSAWRFSRSSSPTDPSRMLAICVKLDIPANLVDPHRYVCVRRPSVLNLSLRCSQAGRLHLQYNGPANGMIMPQFEQLESLQSEARVDACMDGWIEGQTIAMYLLRQWASTKRERGGRHPKQHRKEELCNHSNLHHIKLHHLCRSTRLPYDTPAHCNRTLRM